eukprot:m.262805 g.262805  ORF g.262805 m.262805 type:complete len:487 (-) comp19699_c0_seq2:244-1704(-)
MPLRTLIKAQCPSCQICLAIPLKPVMKTAADGSETICNVRCNACDHVFAPPVADHRRSNHRSEEQFTVSRCASSDSCSSNSIIPDANANISAALLAAVRQTNVLSAIPGSTIQSSTSADSSKSFRKFGKLVMDLNAGTSKVLKDNKIGKEPTGYYRDMAHAFQFGLRKLANSSREVSPHRSSRSPSQDSIVVSWDIQPGDTPLVGSLKAHGATQFKKIRESFNMPDTAFYASLAYMPEQTTPSLRVIGQADAAGRSSAFFFLSPDQRFILKSCTKDDTRQVLRILARYANHVQEYKQTWLNRYFGLFTICSGRVGEKATLLVMNNFFAGQVAIHTRYDLKGSTFHRAASARERKKPAPTYKDLDWIADKRQLCFKDKYADAMKVVRADVDFLAACNLIDYSLLVGIHNRQGTAVQPPPVRAFINRQINSDTVVYFGIVDILTPFVFRKKLEKMYHHTIRWRNASCTDPKSYADRFYRFVVNHSTPE